jgi:hypothetical protein
MSADKHPKRKRISLQRTETVEALLQELWMLRLELKDKPSVTVLMAISALTRESRLRLKPRILERTESLRVSELGYSPAQNPDFAWD